MSHEQDEPHADNICEQCASPKDWHGECLRCDYTYPPRLTNEPVTVEVTVDRGKDGGAMRVLDGSDREEIARVVRDW